MKMPWKIRRGAVLLQTLVMSIILCIISVGVTRWILNRHMSATRIVRSAEARSRSYGSLMYTMASWNITPPTGNISNNNLLDRNNAAINPGRVTRYSYTPASGLMVITYDEDQ